VDTIIWVEVSNQWGCKKTKYYHISLQERPVIDLQDQYHVCLGNSILICAHGVDQYIWSNGMTDSCIMLLPVANEILYVHGIKGACSVLDSVQIFVHPNATVSVPTTILMLQGDTVIIEAQISSDTDYVVFWQPVEGIIYSDDSTIHVSPDSTTTYYVIVQNVWGCTIVDSVLVQVYPPGIYANMMNDTVLCSGDSITLWVNVFLAPTNDLHYQWYPSLGLSSDTVAHPRLWPTISQYYYVSITDNEGHSYYDSVYIEVIKTPEVNLGNDTIACEGSVLTFIDNNPGTHLWFTGDTTNMINITLLSDTIITLEVNNNGCRDRDTVYVDVIKLPILNLGEDKVICQGDSVAIPILTSFEPWGNIKETGIAFISPSEDTIIHYELESQGCKVVDDIYIQVNPIPVFTLQASSESYIEGQPILLEVLPSLFEKYYFYLNGQLQVVNHSGSHYYDMLHMGDVLTVVVENEFGCRSEKTWEGKWRDVPNVFTPNGNDMNDRFLKGIFVKIFNRWGQLLYEGSDGWDGTYQGEPVNEGTYYYLIEFINPELGTYRVYSGSILLIR
ncbi:MAG: gliding motility-associated C-terminal domain-containing protein, partial [Bacteroidales bacterium]|nr:gliding motility-associated C-terminal domain-containing protein [Bacteroidales bacterium]